MLSSYHCSWKMTGVKRRLCSESATHAFHKELDEVSCPICMDHPHNAVLLLCSSHEKGCRSYICDTSYRHSNCLDQFKIMQASSKDSPNLPNSLVNTNNSGISSDITMQSDLNDANVSQQNASNAVFTFGLPRGSRQIDIQDSSSHLDPHDDSILGTVDSETLEDRAELQELDGDNSCESKLSLKCPLCRGTVLGWEVIEEARNYLNLKKRNCSRESCSFAGDYLELRRHARRVHPTTRPSDVDPLRERAWRHFERQREYGDIVSAIRSTMPGAVVVGDYVIENGDGRFSGEREGNMGNGRFSGEREGNMGNANVPWFTTLLLRMSDSIDSVPEPREPREQRALSRAWTSHRSRYLLVENLLGIRDDNNDDVDEGASPAPRRRRSLTRTRSGEI